MLPAPETLRADPDAIVAAREALLAGGAHLHGPEIASRLGIPEAAIMAARIGRDAVELAPDVAALLAPLAGWSKLLVATRSAFGVALCLGRFSTPQLADGWFRIENHEHRIELAIAGIDRVYLLHESDPMHGRSVSLNAFDAAGEAVLRVYLMSKEGRDVAAPHLERFAVAAAARLWHARGAPGATRSGAVLAAPETAARAAHALTRAILTLPGQRGLSLRVTSGSARLATTAVATQASHTPPAVHATGPALKLHLRPAAAATMQRIDDGTRSWRVLALHGDTLEFALTAVEAQTNFDSWLAGLTPIEQLAHTEEGLPS